jgi:hypothetical protein
MIGSLELKREAAAFAEKIALSKLEEAKAMERTRELEYQFARFDLDVMVAACKQQPIVAQQEPPVTEKK